MLFLVLLPPAQWFRTFSSPQKVPSCPFIVIMSFLEFHINGIIHVSYICPHFLIWFLSLSIIILRFIHVGACMNTLFLYFNCWIDSTVWIYHILFFRYQLMYIWAVFSLGLLGITLVWTFVYKHLREHTFSILLDTRSIIAWSYSKCTLNFIRNWQAIFQNICYHFAF